MKNILLTILGSVILFGTYFGQVEYSATGGGNFFTLAYPANVTSLTPGLSFTFKANHTITGNATLNVNGLGNVTIKKEVTQDLVASDILSGQIVTVVYDGINFQMTSKAGTSGGGTSDSHIQDDDADTYIETDALGTGLGNEIDFNLGGTQHFKMVGPRLEFLNSNTSVFIGEQTGQSAGNQSVGIGWLALSSAAGSSNTAVGYQSLRLTTGLNNTALGFRSGSSITGSNNVALGYQTLNLTTTGGENIAIGFNTGGTNTTGSKNTFIGTEADASVNTLSNATAIGANAQVGASNSLVLGSINGVNSASASTKVGIGTTTPAATLDITGTDAIILPQGTTGQRPGTPEAGMLRYNADLTTFEGYDGTAWSDLMAGGAGGTRLQDVDLDTYLEVDLSAADDDQFHFVSSGTEYFTLIGPRIHVANTINSVYIGGNSGLSNPTGTSNSGYGFQTLRNTTTGQHNTALGSNSLLNNVSGSHNVGVGSQSLQNGDGDRNVAIGYRVLMANDADNNIGIGYQTLQNNTTAAGNVAVGSEALRLTTTGGNNTAIGLNSMTVTTGFQNTAVGSSTLVSNLTGNNNNAFGFAAMGQNTTGSNNSAFGNNSLNSNLTSGFNSAFGMQSLLNTTGASNTAIGFDAGKDNTSGSNNLFIGNNANPSVGNLSNATAIGSNAVVGQSNSIVLGSSENIGIGKTAPVHKLDVNGDIGIPTDANKIVRVDEGADLVPVAYGVLNDGAIMSAASTSNFTVAKLGTGQYQITYTGTRTFAGLGEFQLTCTTYYQGETLVANYQYLGGTDFEIFLVNLSDVLTDGIVSFTLRVK